MPISCFNSSCNGYLIEMEPGRFECEFCGAKVYTHEGLLQAITLQPCHVTGMHDPTHTPRYVCSLQREEAFERLLGFLGLTEGELPRKLHDKCYWCHESEGKDKFHRWVADNNSLHPTE